MSYVPTSTGDHLTVVIAADHNGVQMKSKIIALLEGKGHAVFDLGTTGSDVIDYPVLCSRIGERVAGGKADRGIMIGGSGMGEVIACNKVAGIRAGLCGDMFQVGISRGNNDSNVLVLGAKVTSAELARELTLAWMAIEFNGGVHINRLEQIGWLEAGNKLE